MKGQKLFRKRPARLFKRLNAIRQQTAINAIQALDHTSPSRWSQLDRLIARCATRARQGPRMRAPACALRCWGCHMGCVFFGQAHRNCVCLFWQRNRHPPLAESKSTGCRVQINLTSLCHRGIGRSIGDRSAVPARGAVKSSATAQAPLSGLHQGSAGGGANRRHCATFPLSNIKLAQLVEHPMLSACSFIGSPPTQNGRHKHRLCGARRVDDHQCSWDYLEFRHSRQIEEPKR